ncbi:MAG: hypothetical protein AAFU41_10720 [Pseudomonadota bacterium]
MSEVYEYRRAPSKGAILLGTICLVLLVFVVMMTERDYLIWPAWAFGAATIAWMLLPRPVAGIRVDDEYLVLSAWRTPKYVPLDDISHLRATRVSIETEIAIVYKDGRQEGIFAGDLPDIDTLVFVMAERGIPVRDVY